MGSCKKSDRGFDPGQIQGQDRGGTCPAQYRRNLSVIGQYESGSHPEISSLNIALDPNNKGLIWIEGLPQGKIKGLLTLSPATYKLPAQKTETGKDLPEGTLIFDKETNTLSICIGKAYNSANPALVFTENLAAAEPVAVKGKKQKQPAAPKAWIYTGTKLEKSTAVN